MAFTPAPLLRFEPGFRWRNKHDNVRETVARLYNVWNRTSGGREPARHRWRAGLNALRQITLDAAAAGRRVRAYGGGWSLSDAAECPDFLVNTKPLNYLAIGLGPKQVLASARPIARRLAFAQCGVHVMELHTALAGAGLALPTSGASNGQTLAGAVATGTHGAALHFGSMQEFVRGIHLVTEGGRHLYIERASAPVVSSEFVSTLGAEHHENDALFDAALVSFGSFGLIHALMIETVPLYDLQRFRFRTSHRAALELLDFDFPTLSREHALPPAAPYHFEITFNPFRGGASEEGAYVTAMYQLDAEPRPESESESSGGLEPGDDLLNVVGGLSGAAPALVPELVSALVDNQLKLVRGARSSPGDTFGSNSIRGQVLSAELGVAMPDARRTIEALVDVARDAAYAGLVAVRFVKSSRATLAFTRFAPTTCTIELPATGHERTIEGQLRMFRRLDAEGIPFTLHWGQCGDWSEARVRKGHGAAVDTWLAERRKLLSPAGRRSFSNAFLERCGLAG